MIGGGEASLPPKSFRAFWEPREWLHDLGGDDASRSSKSGRLFLGSLEKPQEGTPGVPLGSHGSPRISFLGLPKENAGKG